MRFPNAGTGYIVSWSQFPYFCQAAREMDISFVWAEFEGSVLIDVEEDVFDRLTAFIAAEWPRVLE